MAENETRWEGVGDLHTGLGTLAGKPPRAGSWRDWRPVVKLQRHMAGRPGSQGQEVVGREVDTEETGWPLWLGNGLL